MIMPASIQPDKEWLKHPATLALKAQHEAARRTLEGIAVIVAGDKPLPETVPDLFDIITSTFAEAQREIERLRAEQDSGCHSYRGTAISCEEYEQINHGKRAEQAEAQVRVLREAANVVLQECLDDIGGVYSSPGTRMLQAALTIPPAPPAE